ncbi:arabinofuranosidase catalytic domain-containing protein [Runella sp.]|uniref:arabinofuranosidase catalytic domain-containing protein n=1 Tax=Runella sp. TaxID=1960881 RepID=UPI0030168DEC
MILGINGIIASSINVATSLLLDLYPSAAAAYSVRKLRTLYTGSCIRVRRSSDNTEQDIGFSGTNLDTTALTSFCGAGNGFVTTWYDQSGNARNATQTTAANQPQIVSAGAVITNASKPCLQFDNVNDSLLAPSVVINRPYSIYAQFLQSSTGDKRMISNGLYSADGSINALISSSRATSTVFSEGNVVSAAYASINQNVIVGLVESAISTSKFYYNGTNIAIASPASNDWGDLAFGANTTEFSEPADGKIKETVIWYSDQSANNSGIQNNMNAYYGVY